MSSDTTLEVSVTENVLDVTEIVQTISIVKEQTFLHVDHVEQHLTVENSVPVVEILHQDLHLEIATPYTNINQYFSGEGAVADGTTIEGLGVTADPLSVKQNIVDMALGSFQITNLFNEIPTQVDRQEAQQNLGLHIIDGGTF